MGVCMCPHVGCVYICVCDVMCVSVSDVTCVYVCCVYLCVHDVISVCVM